MKAFKMSAIAVSTLALTANSWGYPIHTNATDSFFASEKAGKFIAIETQRVGGQSRSFDVFSLANTFSEDANPAFDNYSFVLAALQDSANERLFNEMKLWKPNKDSLVLWVGHDLREKIWNAAGKAPVKNDDTESPGNTANKSQPVSVSEPSSVALIFSGVFGLIMARRLSKRNKAVASDIN